MTRKTFQQCYQDLCEIVGAPATPPPEQPYFLTGEDVKLIKKNKDLEILETGLEKGTYQISKINQSNLGREYYVVESNGACLATYAVLVDQRPKWGKRFGVANLDQGKAIS